MGKVLPSLLHSLFWEYNVRRISWTGHRDFIVARILQSGTLDQLRWLRSKVTDKEIRGHILRHHGRGLSSRQLRFWEAIIGLPRQNVNRWLKDPVRKLWESRFSR